MTEKEFLKQLDKRLKDLTTKDDIKIIKRDVRGTKDDVRGIRDDILSLKLDIGELKEEVKANTEITQETRILVDKALKYAKDAKEETSILDREIKNLEAKI